MKLASPETLLVAAAAFGQRPASPAFKRKVARATRAANGPPLEFEIHTEVADALRRAGVRFFHPPNESRSTARHRANLKRLGLSKGVPDLIITTPPPCGGYVAAALEIKREKGRASKEQTEWLEHLAQCGWATACERGLEACLARLRKWGYEV